MEETEEGKEIMSRKRNMGKAIKESETVNMVHIYSVKDYFNTVVKELGNGKPRMEDLDRVKALLLHSFQQELYGQIVFKLGPEAAEMKPDDLADLDGIQSILQQTFRKWRRLCILCSERGLGNWLRLEDLQDALSEGPKEVILPNPEEDMTERLDEVLPPGEKPVYLEKEDAEDLKTVSTMGAENDASKEPAAEPV